MVEDNGTDELVRIKRNSKESSDSVVLDVYCYITDGFVVVAENPVEGQFL